MSLGDEFMAKTIDNLGKLEQARDRIRALEAELHAVGIRAHEARALLAKLVRHAARAETSSPSLGRLVDQVRDYLNRTADPRDILRSGEHAAATDATWERVCSCVGYPEGQPAGTHFHYCARYTK